MPVKRGPDIAAQLGQALLASADRAGFTIVIERHDSQPWASVTFDGCRHALTLRATGGSGIEVWLAMLPDAEFALPGHIVADVEVIEVSQRHDRLIARLEALTIVD